MGEAKPGGQEVKVGEVSVECAEKTGFLGFGFFRQGDNCALRGEDGSQRGKCNSQCRATVIMSPFALVRNVP